MAPTSYMTAFYPESTFGGFSDVDGSIRFYSRVHALISPASRVVDFGCGRGSHAEDRVPFRRNLKSFKGKVAKVIGLDVDPAGCGNPLIDEFAQLIPGNPWPLEDKSADLVVCDCVIEHLPDPPAFFREARRVLVAGGYLCVRTPNVLNYVCIASRLIPNRHHSKVLENVQLNRKAEDVFPTLYRCNTVFAVRAQMAANGFRAVVYGYEGDPGYLHFSKLAYALGVLHQKFAPAFLKPAIFAFGQLQS